jgi:hypothetical protein
MILVTPGRALYGPDHHQFSPLNESEKEFGCGTGMVVPGPYGLGYPRGYPPNSDKAVLGVAHPQGVEGLGMAGPGGIVGSLWIPLAIRVWLRILNKQERVNRY